jgi:hypothetical protein
MNALPAAPRRDQVPMAQTRRMKSVTPQILGILVVALGCGSEIDSCMDLGGSYDYQFAECDRKRNHPGPNSACLHDLPGTWVVSGHLAPGVSAMSEVEASSWIGSVLYLSRKEVAFREEGCSSPSFETREIPRPKFEEEFRTSWTSLGLPNAPVCVTEVSCADKSSVPGSLLIHGRGELLALWDGVYFRLHRQ